MEDNKEVIQFKPAKTTKEMTKYLLENKRVRYNIISDEEAQDLLLKYNYINIITLFKHHFAKVDSKKQVIKENGKHVYERDVEFLEYYSKYREERETYPIIYSNIMEFEAHFKSIVSYHIVNNTSFSIKDSDDLTTFLSKIEMSISLLPGYSEERRNKMVKSVSLMASDVYKYHDVYCFFDRMTLSQTLSIFEGLDKNIQNDIFSKLKKYGMDLETDQVPHFINRVFILVSVRNCVMHNNSLEILVRFYNVKDKIIRTSYEQKRYLKVIEIMKKEK